MARTVSGVITRGARMVESTSTPSPVRLNSRLTSAVLAWCESLSSSTV